MMVNLDNCCCCCLSKVEVKLYVVTFSLYVSARHLLGIICHEGRSPFTAHGASQ